MSVPPASVAAYHGWVHNATPAVNAQSQYPIILGVCISLTLFMVSVVGLRFYVRGVMIRSIGWDDWVVLASAVCSIIYNALCITQSRYGLGLPLKLRPKVNINRYSEANLAGRPFYQLGVLGFKVALCIAYLRIVPRDRRFYKLLIWGLLVTCTAGHLAGLLILLFQCHPVRKSWRPLLPGKCLPNVPTFYGLGAVTITFDVIIFSIPIPLLAKVQINRRRKYALIGIFLVGLFTTVCSILRMIQIIRISRDGNSTGLVLWGTIEMNVGHIAKMTTAYGSDNSKDSYNLEALSRGHASIHRPQRSSSKRGRTNESKDSILCDNNSLYQPPSPSRSMGNDSGRGTPGITKMTELNISTASTSMVTPGEKERVSRHHSGSGTW